MINLFEALEFEGFPITPHRRVRRIHMDRARELTSDFLEAFLTRYPQVLLTHTKGYDPQANGTAERDPAKTQYHNVETAGYPIPNPPEPSPDM
eukprot:462761-Amphidinium_carterae.2